MPLTPVFVEKATGDETAPTVEEEFGGVTREASLNQYVDFVGRRVLPFSKRKDFPHKFQVLESREIPNAFALGNGNVYVTRALLDMLDDEAELAEIIGHEVGHVANRHIASKIDTVIGTMGLLALAQGIYEVQKGDKVPESSRLLIEKANELVPALVINGFGRAQELESDEDGLKYMVSAGYDPRAAVRVFEKFQKLEGEVPAIDVFFRSHPTAKDRVSDLEKRIASKYPGVTGQAYRDRFQSVVKGSTSLSDAIPSSPLKTIALAAGVVVLVGGAVYVVSSVL